MKQDIKLFSTVLAAGLKDAGKKVDAIAKKSGADVYASPQELIGKGIQSALTMLGLVFLVLMIYAGYLWMTTRGEEEQAKKAQKIITTSVIGFALVASAYAITLFVSQAF